MTHERIGKPCPLCRQTVYVGRLHLGMTVTSQSGCSLVIGEKENDVRSIRALNGPNQTAQAE